MKKYWIDTNDLEQKPAEVAGDNEADGFSLMDVLQRNGAKSSRRDFLKAFGFSIAGAAVAASCERPVKKAIPYLVQPEEVMPGKASFYASTFYDGEQYCPIMVKVRDGRPIKIEGNTLSSLTRGGTSAIVQASLLSLYDENRIKQPLISGVKSSWDKMDRALLSQLRAYARENKKIVLVTSSIISPSTKSILKDFTATYPNIAHLSCDPLSVSAILQANESSFGSKFIPSYRFDKASVIVGFDADFLGTWISPVEFAGQYGQNRKLDRGQGSMSRHIQVETGMSLTGSNADDRYSIKPSGQKVVLANLLNYLLENTGNAPVNGIPDCSIDVQAIGDELLQNKGKSLLVCGSNDPDAQLMVNRMNQLLGNYGTTIDISHPVFVKQGEEQQVSNLAEDIQSGTVQGVIFYNVNPVYDHPRSHSLREALNELELSVHIHTHWNETALECNYVCPDNHYLESWNDAMPSAGSYSLSQPVIHPLFDTRQFQESLMRWMDRSTAYVDYLKDYWQRELYPWSAGHVNFTDFWNHCLHDGVFETGEKHNEGASFRNSDPYLREMMKTLQPGKAESIELQLYASVQIGSGRHANNPWLQEAPDGVSKVTWDNYAALSPKFAKEQGLKTGDVIRIDENLSLPVLIQPGQHYNTISAALGYGRSLSGKASEEVGKNMYPLVRIEEGRFEYHREVSIRKVAGSHAFAMTQTHHSMEERPIIREATLEDYLENPAAGNEMHEEIQHHLESLYPEPKFKGHHWGMIVDLNSCIGCNACLIACSAENNVPVVGKEEVKRAHEMHWIRIDRYYSGDPENPELVRQPVMCQHCDNAPCENVCPVAATTHSNEGINQMAYNRCIGTRYCNNNCPYKVRRFNWYDYTRADAIPDNTIDPAGLTLDLPRMVLNPDVTVRAKGVMEKCTFCVQRIQEKKLDAKLEKRPLGDGEVKTACQQACPVHAIVFGDLNNSDSEVSRLMKDQRNYHLLEQLHTLPSVGYLTKIRNKRNTS